MAPLGYLLEYGAALFWELWLSIKVQRRHGFDIIHACNPPDLIFLVALFHKPFFGTSFLFDQHDLDPELFEVKFGRKGLFAPPPDLPRGRHLPPCRWQPCHQ